MHDLNQNRLETTLRLAEEVKSGSASALKELCRHLQHALLRPTAALQRAPGRGQETGRGLGRKNRLVPFFADDEHVMVATSKLLSLESFDELSFVWGRRVDVAGAPEDEILTALNFFVSVSMDTADDVAEGNRRNRGGSAFRRSGRCP